MNPFTKIQEGDKSSYRYACSSSRERGFTLLEVLIAVIILSIGLLGVAAIQLKGMQYNHDAYLRSQVYVLATDIAERMRLNRANASAYIEDYEIGAATSTCTIATGANAANDLACWRDRVNDALPSGGDADIAAVAGLYTVSLSWDDRDGVGRDIDYSFTP